MIIGIDIDEVLCRTNDYFLFELNKKYGTNFRREELVRYDYNCFKGFSGEDIFNELIEHLHNNLIYYDIFDGSKEILKKLKKDGHKLYIITSRWKEFEEKTLIWLEKHFGKNFFDKILIYNDKFEKKSKDEIAKENNIDVLIEDAPKYALKASKNKIRVLLMNHPWNKDLEENEFLIRVYSWEDIYEKIKNFNK